MFIKLVQQDKIIDTHTEVGNLDFSGLSGYAPWEIWITRGEKSLWKDRKSVV